MPEHFRILGQDDACNAHTAEQFVATVHPEDRGRVVVSVAALEAGVPQSLRFRLVRPSGEVRRVASRSAIVRDAIGTRPRPCGR